MDWKGSLEAEKRQALALRTNRLDPGSPSYIAPPPTLQPQYSITPLLQYSITPLLHYSITAGRAGTTTKSGLQWRGCEDRLAQERLRAGLLLLLQSFSRAY
jgi:hypothetical protein